uniref:Uncharacterized protein n=1 Tax=Peronospora matthiolae TaxID=2874970 RepID=A0AAV1T9G7_9STRA
MRVTIDNSGGYVLDQAEAIGELLHDSALLTETKVQGAPTIKTFRSFVGSLLWIARCTRPDIAFAVHKATRQTHQPRLHDLKLAKRIARYLKRTQDYKLRMEPAKHLDIKIQLEAYSDADFAAEKSDRKSFTGSIIRLNGMPVSWTSKKQGGVSLSTMEAEFVAASEQARELLGFREMLNEIGKPPALPMYIDVRTKFVCDFARRGIILSQYVRPKQQLADHLTKALDAVKLAALCEMIGLDKDGMS